MFKVNEKDMERNQGRYSVAFILNVQQISHRIPGLMLLSWKN